MEPMTLGSPVGSPGSPPTSPYLPAFLMGEPAATPGSISMTKTSPLTGKQLSFGTSPTLGSPMMETRTRPSASVLHNTEKGSGPPTRGLYDAEEITFPTIQSPLPNMCSRLNTSIMLDVTQAPTFSVSTPTHSEGYWVTVFGFPASAASHILSQFSQYGTVLASKSSPRGNWLHIKYQSAIEARKALSNNGKVFGGTFMVAVMPCKDPDVLMESSDKENQSFFVPEGFFSPSTSYQRTPTSGFRGADLSAQSRALSGGTPLTQRQTSARPLTQAYRAAQHPSEVVCTHFMPQRSTSFVGKAMEYFFGW